MTTFAAVHPPDEATRQAALDRHRELTKPAGSLGRLESLGAWLAACQGTCPPEPLRRPRIVVFAGDHGIAARGVSAYPSEVTAQMVANIVAGGAAINVLAAGVGAEVRVVDLAVDADTPADVRTVKVRRSSGAIDVEDALSEDELAAALAAGKSIVDEEVDAGADLLVAGDLGIANTTVAAVLVAALTGTEPVAVVGRGTGIDDHTWMRKTAAIRDALRRARPVSAEPEPLLRTVGGADIAAMAAFLAQAAVRRTPVVLDGVVATAAALVAEELAPGARNWWVAGHRSPEPSHAIALTHLDLEPLLDLGMRLGEGSGATAAVPLLIAAVGVLADMATFAEAGVSGPAAAPPSDTPDPDPDTSTEPADSITAPAADPGTEPATDPAAEPPADSGAEPAADSRAEPAGAPHTEPAAESRAEPLAEPGTEPASDPHTEPPADSGAEPAADSRAEPASDPRAEPANDPRAEPASAHHTEPPAGSRAKPASASRAGSAGDSRAEAAAGAREAGSAGEAADTEPPAG